MKYLQLKSEILIIYYFIFLVTNNCWAISQTQNLLIKVNITSKSKMVLDRTNITLSNDPEVNTDILMNPIQIISKTKTGVLSETTIEVSADLVNVRADAIPMNKTIISSTNQDIELAWKKVAKNLFQGDVWDALILNLNYQDDIAGPYSTIVRYTLVTP
jgi:hypothetical protein